MTNLKPSQIIAIGAAIVFGLPIAVGLAVGHFFGFWFGVAAGGIVLLLVAFLGHRHMVKMAKEQEKHPETEDRDDA